jgi:hypothetical protein
VLERCKVALDDADVEIPFPHLQLLVDRVEEHLWQQARELKAASDT